jgi:hypothetical protein
MKSLEFLLEYDRGKTAAAYGAKMLPVALKDKWFVGQLNSALPNNNLQKFAQEKPEQILDYLLTWLERGDPTRNKEYTQAIAKMYGNGESSLEDIVSTLADYLSKFDRLKRKKKIQPPRNDFNRYRSLEDFYDVVDEYPDEEEQPKQEEKKNTTELYRDSQLIVLIPRDMEAACYYGQGTRWCTAGQNYNRYEYYAKQGDLYIIIPRQQAYPGEKYQFHFESRQFMNEQDRQIGAEGLEKLVDRFPVLKKVLQNPAERFNVKPLISDEYKEIVLKSTPEVSKETAELIEKYKDRIVAFGFKSLSEYGVRLPEPAQQQIGAALIEYIDAVMANMAPIYKMLIANPGDECQPDFVETAISGDAKIQALAKNSTALKLTIEAIQASGQKLHKDAIPHVTDLVVREPLARILRTQIPKLYRARLQAHGHALQ